MPSNTNIICGDFNIDLSSNSSNVQNFKTEMSSWNLSNIISNPTRVTFDPAGNVLSNTIIDHIWTTSQINFSFVLNYQLTDHYPIGCSLDLPCDSQNYFYKSRAIGTCKIPKFQQDFKDFFNNIFITPDTNGVFNEIFSSLKNIISTNFPIETKRKKTKNIKRPWIDRELRSLISKKYLLYSKCSMGLLPFSHFKNYRNLLNRTLDLAKSIYYENSFKNLKGNSKQTWKVINKLSNPCKKKKQLNVYENNILIDNDQTLAIKFNSYFRDATPTSNNPCNPSYHMDINPNTFFCAPISPQEVLNTLSTMKNNSLLSDLPIKLLKLLHEPLSFLLSRVFNLAIANETFPDVLKCGVITPIPKKLNAKSIPDHRGITILNPISKILDKLLYNRLYSFFDTFNLFSPQQFGFLKKRGIEQAALNLMYHINKANSQNETTVAVFIDLTKAFDCLDHNILINKLYRYGIRGSFLNFLKSYLNNRSHITRINDCFSSSCRIEKGVAQGSNLGPLLFNIFLNDVTNVIEDCNILIYADDIVIFKSSKNLRLIQESLETNLLNLCEYFNDNKLFINFNKTKAMQFSRGKYNNIDISLNDNIIEFVDEFTYLGLTIDKKLTFQSHITKITKKVNQGNGKIYYLSKFLPLNKLKNIFYSTIYPHVNLHILIWGGADATHIQLLVVALNKTIRNMYRGDDDTLTKYRKLHILPVSNIYELRLAEFFYKTIKLNEPQLLTNILDEISFEHSYNTRRRDDFKLPLISTKVNSRFFLSNGIKLWRTIPDSVKCSSSLPKFREQFKNIFFSPQTAV